jgi:hypothetical protein
MKVSPIYMDEYRRLTHSRRTSNIYLQVDLRGLTLNFMQSG